MPTTKRTALLLAATFLSTLTHSLHAQSPEADERQRAVGGAIEKQLSSTKGRAFHISTDKPLYHPGETIWFRAWELTVRDLSATTGEHGITAQLIDPRGAKVAEKRILSKGGVATNDFLIASSLPGGSYTIRMMSELGGQHDHPIQISSYEVPRLKKAIEFTRASYAPGDTVTALVHVEKATGEPLTGARVTANIMVGDTSIGTLAVPIDVKGDGMVRFQVPPGMKQSNLTMTLNADAGGIVETLQKRVPVVLQQVAVSVFPEGGDLVADLPSRVYLMARDEQGKPAEVAGQVLDDKGTVVTSFKSFHDGMARFPLTPKAGRTYSVRITKPGTSTVPVPAARASGCVLQSEDDFDSKRSNLKLTTTCSGATKLVIAATLREKLLASAPFNASAGAPSTIELPIPSDAVGAVRVTLFDENKNPMAERLVYRGHGRELRVKVSADKKEYAPREKVTLTVRTSTPEGKPVAADVALAVVDDAVLRFADSKAPHLLSDLYLLHEMPGQQIHEPNFYFSDDKKAPEALDLLVGTQGYRRFTWAWVPR